MSHAAWWTSKSFVRSCLLAALMMTGASGLQGCATPVTASQKLQKKLKIGEPVIDVFVGKYEEVETALKQAMIRYPQRVDNTEAGIFETDYVKGETRFKGPHQMHVNYTSGYRYRMIVRLVRGKKDGRQAVKVVVLKDAELIRDFFSPPDPQPSDGLEERVILYRVRRELEIARGLQRANQRANQKSNQDV
jgi:hypothetical protein